MNTEDLFKYGVTPKDGEKAGKRFRVLKIEPTGVYVNDWEDGNRGFYLANGAYDLWREPKTLFEDHSIHSTWGNLKKAVEAAGFGDETMFVVHDFLSGFRESEMRTTKLLGYKGEITCIIVE